MEASHGKHVALQYFVLCLCLQAKPMCTCQALHFVKGCGWQTPACIKSNLVVSNGPSMLAALTVSRSAGGRAVHHAAAQDEALQGHSRHSQQISPHMLFPMSKDC